jgi:hypothetical protein
VDAIREPTERHAAARRGAEHHADVEVAEGFAPRARTEEVGPAYAGLGCEHRLQTLLAFRGFGRRAERGSACAVFVVRHDSRGYRRGAPALHLGTPSADPIGRGSSEEARNLAGEPIRSRIEVLGGRDPHAVLRRDGPFEPPPLKLPPTTAALPDEIDLDSGFEAGADR